MLKRAEMWVLSKPYWRIKALTRLCQEIRISFAFMQATLLSSLRTRLMLLVFIGLLPLLGLALYTAEDQRKDAAREVKMDALRVARLCASNQERLLESARQLLVTLAQLPGIQNKNRAFANPLLKRILEQYPSYANLGAVDASGNVFASALPFEGPMNLADRSYFQRAVEGKGFAVGNYQIGRITGKATLNVAYPVLNEQEEVLAVVYAALDLNWVHQIASRVDLPPETAMSVIDQDATVLARFPHPEKWIGHSMAGTPVGQAILQNQTEGTLEGEGLDGIHRLYAFTKLPGVEQGANLYVTIGIPSKAAYAGVRRMLWIQLATLGVVAVIALGATWVFSSVLVLNRVKRLLSVTKKVAAGDLSARASDRGKDELSQLAGAFNEMTVSLEKRSEERDRAEEDLRQLNESLEQRVAERTMDLKRSNEELEQFAYVASHDLQEPLRMVASYTQLLARRYREKLDQNGLDFIAFAVDGAQRMQQFINDLLEYSRVGTRGKPFQKVDAAVIVGRALQNLKIAIEEKEAVIEVDPLPEVWCDPIQLTQLFQNLIGNAVKFRREELPRVRISSSENEGEWEFRVEDNGIGISREYFDRIFVIFQRLHTREEYAGTGIGLAICKKIVERHRGRIWVESTEGAGTTFYFTIAKMKDEPGADA